MKLGKPHVDPWPDPVFAPLPRYLDTIDRIGDFEAFDAPDAPAFARRAPDA
jgi:hypothetical protein